MYSNTISYFYYNYIKRTPTLKKSWSILDAFNHNYYNIKNYEIQEL